MSVLRENIDANPYTGSRKVSGQYLRLSNNEWLNKYYDGSPNVEQVTGVTRGKIYEVVEIEGYGDVEDVTIIDDDGNELVLADFFFEDM